MLSKYGARASASLATLDNSPHATVLHSVDATSLDDRVGIQYDRVVFNFPHVGKGIKDEAVNVRENQELLAAFFEGCCAALRPGGEMHVAVKVGKPYSMWNILGLAHRASSGQLEQVTEYCFDPAWFPEYAHRRTAGFQEGLSMAANEEISGRSKTYVLRMKKA